MKKKTLILLCMISVCMVGCTVNGNNFSIPSEITVTMDFESDSMSTETESADVQEGTSSESEATYWCLGQWSLDYSSLEEDYETVDYEYSGAYGGFQNNHNGMQTIIAFWDVLFMSSPAIFMENYLTEYAGGVRSMELCNAKYMDANTGNWEKIPSVYLGSNGGAPGYEGSYNFGTYQDRIWMIASGVGGDWYNNGKGRTSADLPFGE